MMMNNSLSKNFFDIFLKGKTKKNKLYLKKVVQSTAMFLQKEIKRKFKSILSASIKIICKFLCPETHAQEHN